MKILLIASTIALFSPPAIAAEKQQAPGAASFDPGLPRGCWRDLFGRVFCLPMPLDP